MWISTWIGDIQNLKGNYVHMVSILDQIQKVVM